MNTKRLIIIAVGLLVSGMVASADTVYLDDSQGNLWVGDPTTGAFTLVGHSALAASFTGLADIDFTSDGTLYGLDPDGNLYTVSTVDGSISLVGATGVHTGELFGLAGDGSGNLYSGGTGQIFQINPGTGAAGGSLGGGSQGYTTAGDLEFIGSTLYLTSTTGGSISGGELWSVTTGTGVGTDIGDTGHASVFGLAYDTSSATLYGYTSAGIQFTINPATGAGSVGAMITGTSIGVGGDILLGAAATTPEPGTFGLILAGVIVVCRRFLRA